MVISPVRAGGQQLRRAVNSQRQLKTTAANLKPVVSHRTTLQRKAVSVQRAPMQFGAEICPPVTQP